MKIIKYIGIIVASLALCIAAVLFIQFNESQKWSVNGDQYNTPKQTIYLNTNDDPKIQKKVINAIGKVTQQYHLGVMRIDDQVNQAGTYLIGVYDPGNQIKFTDEHNDLINSGFATLDTQLKWSTQRLDTNHKTLFNLLRNSNVTVVSIKSLLNHTQTVNGTYQFFGSNHIVYQNVLHDIASKSGISEKNLTTQHTFKKHSISMYFNLTLLLVSLMFIVIIITSLFSIYHSSEAIGIKKMMGYSTWSIIGIDLGNIFLVILLSIMFEISVINCLLGPVLISVYPTMLLFQCPLVGVVILSLLFQYIIVRRQKLAAFIKGQIKATFMLVTIFMVFTLVTVITAYTLKVVDYQASQLYLNNKKIDNWHNKERYQVLSEISTGNDSASFTFQSSKLAQDLKSFYGKIANKPGVLWASSTWFYNDHQQRADLYNFWRLPNISTFALLQLSPSGVSQQNLTDEYGHSIIIQNNDEHRYYLLPKKDKQNEKFKQFFEYYPILGSSVDPKNSQAVNKFLANQHIKILYYNTPKQFESWDDSNSTPLKQPVIEVITSKNMTNIDATNMMVIGLENPLRLTKNVIQTKAFQEALNSSSLADNHLVFSSIKDTLSFNQAIFYKSLSGGAAFLLIFVIIICYNIITLNEIWQIANKKKITVKRFLGYKDQHKYLNLYLILSCLNLLIILVGLAVKSIFLVTGFLFIWALEILLLKQCIKRLENQPINQIMKE